MVMGALTGPSAMSGSDIGFATSAATAVCAMAPPAKGIGVTANVTRDKAMARAWRLGFN